jgi:hypothetical protein
VLLHGKEVTVGAAAVLFTVQGSLTLGKHLKRNPTSQNAIRVCFTLLEYMIGGPSRPTVAWWKEHFLTHLCASKRSMSRVNNHKVI